ncbi:MULTISPECIES: mechanosensitive ion channel family protein [unclassified Oleiphilus]|jgi:MscS family membrane protein|uniref:mechanosensitive ion channel family protein n=1 Tax=unclassified Oleiphilus TaxID=2631174 RepID=UPI0009ED1EE4|nr:MULTISPECIES: mechanosensitive ion channel family protein [unclassified Oleiphilus]
MNWNILNTFLLNSGLENLLVRQVVEISIILLLTGLISFLSKVFLKRVEAQFLKTRNLWDDTLLHSSRSPIALVIWLLGLSWIAYSVQRQSGVDLSVFISNTQQIIIVFCLVWFVVRFISGGEKIVVCGEKMKQPMDETTVSAIGKLLRAIVIIIGVLVVLQTMGYSMSGVLAFGGVGGLAVGFAAKDLLANFFGGLMIYLDRPFKVGDWVRSPDKEIEGTVIKIGWRLTTIKTFDKRPLYVPNSVFTNISVQNPSRMSHRRVYETIGIRYDDAAALPRIISNVKAMLLQHPEIDTTQTLIVNFNAYAASSLDFFIYTFTKTTDWIKYHEVKQDVLIRVYDIIAAENAEIAFPTSTLHMPEALRIEGEIKGQSPQD